MKKYLPYLNILGAAACWGCIGLFNRFLMCAGMGAANIVVIRNFGGLVLLTLIFALRERSVFHVKAKHLPIFFGTGVVSMVFFTLCYFKCQELCSLAVSAILLYTAPAMVVLMSAAVFRERITRKKLLALALALLTLGQAEELHTYRESGLRLLGAALHAFTTPDSLPMHTPQDAAAFFPRIPAVWDSELPSPAALLLHALALADACRPQAGYKDAALVLWQAAAPYARQQPLACAGLIDAAHFTLSESREAPA